MFTPAETPRGGVAQPRWGMGDAALGWLFAQFLAAIAGALILGAAGYGTDGKGVDDASMALLAVLQMPLWIGFVATPVWAARTKGYGIVEDFRLRVAPSDVVGLPIGVAAQLVMVPLVSYPFLRLTGTDMDKLSEPARELAQKARDGSTLGVVLFALVVVVGAPIVEELFFRGLVLRSIEKRWGSALGLIGSSVLFGVTHFQALQLPALTVAGVIFGALALRSDRLGPSIACHMAFNATTVVTLLWFT
ncbi:MAG: CPBP family intramembrane metalloprotease [Acidimicrobiales bacterium]|nr:CPBP family intramembrane metalloprotease [Acidimicrobiales bacterium]